VVTPPGFLPGFRPAVLLEKRASEALWSHHRTAEIEDALADVAEHYAKLEDEP
jgi:hypothetical protein